MKKIKKTILAIASVGEEHNMIQENLTGNEFGLDVMNDLESNNVSVSVKLWLKGEHTDEKTLRSKYGKMFSKNDYLVEIH